MLSILRKSEDFKQRIQNRFEAKIKALPEDLKGDLATIKAIEDERDQIMDSYEDELRLLELKFDKLLNEKYSKRNEYIASNSKLVDYWLGVLSNHKIIKDYIGEKDIEALKYLEGISAEKLEDGNSFRIVFSFKENPFFENKQIAKTYLVSKEILIEKIESTPIVWKEEKCLTKVMKEKKMKNKKTGEIKTVPTPKSVKSFFNFFTNLRIPTVEEIKTMDSLKEKELGHHLDTEYELGLEFIEELIPHSVEYYIGVKHDTEEYVDYVNEQFQENFEKTQK